MLTFKRPHNTPTRYKKKVKQQTSPLPAPYDLQQEDRRFRRCLTWGAVWISFFIILKMFYLFDGVAWIKSALA